MSRPMPSRIVGLDTSVRRASVALVDGDVCVEAVAAEDLHIAAQLPTLLTDLVRTRGLELSQLDVLAVALGPGGFTGLRVGIATIQGLALGLDRPVVGVPVLQALAARSAEVRPPRPGERRTVVMDGQRGDVFVAQYAWTSTDAGVPMEVHAPIVCRADDRGAIEAIGEAALVVVRPQDEAQMPAGCRAADLCVAGPLAASVARLARVSAQRGLTSRPHALQPIYVRRPDVELARDQAPPAAAASASRTTP